MDIDYKHSDITDKIIRAFYNVYNNLGYGFLEKVYERSLIIELKKLGLTGYAQVPVKVYYDGEEVGSYFADVLVENCVIVEIKTCNGLIEEHEAQLLNYLRATSIEVGLLLNFGLKPGVKRKVFTNRKIEHK
jgi:GxxExxY protein